MPKAPQRPKPKGQEPDSAGQGEMQTTAIHIRKEDWNLLRSVSFHRAQSTGGSELENEVKGKF
jgi:hypothetical protein